MKPKDTRYRHGFAACVLSLSVAIAPVWAQGSSTDFGNRTPSAEEFGQALKVNPESLGLGQSRQLRVQKAEPPKASLQVRFGLNSDALLAASEPALRNLAQAMNSSLKGQKFRLVGHTDGTGGAELNQTLSQRRADAVRAFLVKEGVEAPRLSTEGRGANELINKGDPAAAENRRVEIVAAP